MANTDTYKMVTDRILKQLKEGIIPWEKPWFGTNNAAYNRVTNKNYSFLNQMLVGKGGEYASYQQWMNAGAKVKKGEKASQIFFWKMYEVEKTDKESGEKYKDRLPVLRYYNVFHIDQVEPIFEDKPITPVREDGDKDMVNNDDRIFVGDDIIKSYMEREGVKFREVKTDTAFYSPSVDAICVPCFEQFKNGPEYYSTTFHEMTHSTGHPKRLNRPGGRFGSMKYSFEELIAEIGSALLLSDSGIATEHTERNNVAYIQSWITYFSAEGNEKVFVKAAGAAEKAVKFIITGDVPMYEAKEPDKKEESPAPTVEPQPVVKEPVEATTVADSPEGKDVVYEEKPKKTRTRKAAPKKGSVGGRKKKPVVPVEAVTPAGTGPSALA